MADAGGNGQVGGCKEGRHSEARKVRAESKGPCEQGKAMVAHDFSKQVACPAQGRQDQKHNPPCKERGICTSAVGSTKADPSFWEFKPAPRRAGIR